MVNRFKKFFLPILSSFAAGPYANTLFLDAMDVTIAQEVPLFLAGVDARAAKKAARRVPKQKKGS